MASNENVTPDQRNQGVKTIIELWRIQQSKGRKRFDEAYAIKWRKSFLVKQPRAYIASRARCSLYTSEYLSTEAHITNRSLQNGSHRTGVIRGSVVWITLRFDASQILLAAIRGSPAANKRGAGRAYPGILPVPPAPGRDKRISMRHGAAGAVGTGRRQG
ncbi:hypothetical protein Bbelb_174920 [Branchiostoma belcheri]|nr:hypothetical protein Bbelb_174920 [Branchiostoma belcheri]